VSQVFIFVIDDFPSSREGICSWFKDESEQIRVAGTAANVEEAILNGIPETVRIIILDLFIKGSSPRANIRALKACYPCKSVIILTMEDGSIWPQIMRREGASAYLTKEIGPEAFKEAIVKVVSGESIFPVIPEDTHILTERIPFSPEMLPQRFGFSNQEKEVIAKHMNGKHPKEIAADTYRTPSAVDKVFARMRKKLKVKSNIQLILEIFRRMHN
jgi:DNA-binding NarL/FixJ family response regulator